MKISKQARREAKSLFRICQANGLLDENRVRLAVQQVLSQKPHGYLAIVSHTQKFEELVLFTFWLICILTALWQTRCRGRECLVRTMVCSVVGMLLPLAIIKTLFVRRVAIDMMCVETICVESKDLSILNTLSWVGMSR